MSKFQQQKNHNAPGDKKIEDLTESANLLKERKPLIIENLKLPTTKANFRGQSTLGHENEKTSENLDLRVEKNRNASLEEALAKIKHDNKKYEKELAKYKASDIVLPNINIRALDLSPRTAREISNGHLTPEEFKKRNNGEVRIPEALSELLGLENLKKK